MRAPRVQIKCNTAVWYWTLSIKMYQAGRPDRRPLVFRLTDTELYTRSSNTLIASWEAYACGAVRASVKRLPGVAAALFPEEPERAFYNNALLDRDLSPIAHADAVDVMQAAYRAAGITHFAAWVHESDRAMRGELERRGYSIDTSTRAMGMMLDDIALPRPQIDLRPAAWPEYLAMEGLPPDFLQKADHTAFHVLSARMDGELVAAALAYDLDGDRGIYNVGTLERARRRGLGTALTAAQVHDARSRGGQTASLQSTPMAERVYTAVGFRDLGRILEYVPCPPEGNQR
jgi:GNAT superfamily N-acetyltransferase